MATVEFEDMEEETWVLWGALLKQAQANLAQARANEETSRAMHTPHPAHAE